MSKKSVKTFETIAVEVATMEKQEIIDKITHFHGNFKLDFTPEFLEKMSADRLRHILLAAIMTNSRSASTHLSGN